MRAFAVAALVSALTIGCSNAPDPSADTAPTTMTATPLAVPPVPEPLDGSAFRDTPCDLISPDQASGLGLPNAELDHSAGRPTCTWRSDRNDQNSLETLTIRFQSENGLTKIADQCRTRNDCDSWTVDTISGYPVIRANGPLERKYGMCRLFVGIADDVAFLVTDGDVTTPQEDAPDGPRCDRADQATNFAINTMTEAG